MRIGNIMCLHIADIVGYVINGGRMAISLVCISRVRCEGRKGGATVSNRLISISYKHAHGASNVGGGGDDMGRIGHIGGSA